MWELSVLFLRLSSNLYSIILGFLFQRPDGEDEKSARPGRCRYYKNVRNCNIGQQCRTDNDCSNPEQKCCPNNCARFTCTRALYREAKKGKYISYDKGFFICNTGSFRNKITLSSNFKFSVIVTTFRGQMLLLLSK